MKRFLQAHSLALEEEEMENQLRSYMKIYQSNETVKPHQQLPVEELLIKSNSLNLQVTISEAQSLDEVMKPMPPIPTSKEEKPQLMPIRN